MRASFQHPYIRILEQPLERGFRFRYKSEAGAHGGLPAESSQRNNKRYPTIRIENYIGPARVEVSLMTNEPEPRLHVHKLVGKNCEDGICHATVLPENEMSICFQNLGILHVPKKEVLQILSERLEEEYKIQKMMNGEPVHGTDLTDLEKQMIRQNAEENAKTMELNVIRLCFQAFILDSSGNEIPIPPVLSNPVYDSKSPNTAALKICRIDKQVGFCTGNEEIFLLCERVQKDDICVRFFELDDHGKEIWHDYGKFSIHDVHKQYAIVFRTPQYRIVPLAKPARVFIQLQKKKDGLTSEPKPFTFKPHPIGEDQNAARKRTKYMLSVADLEILNDALCMMENYTGDQGVAKPLNNPVDTLLGREIDEQFSSVNVKKMQVSEVSSSHEKTMSQENKYEGEVLTTIQNNLKPTIPVYSYAGTKTYENMTQTHQYIVPKSNMNRSDMNNTPMNGGTNYMPSNTNIFHPLNHEIYNQQYFCNTTSYVATNPLNYQTGPNINTFSRSNNNTSNFLGPSNQHFNMGTVINPSAQDGRESMFNGSIESECGSNYQESGGSSSYRESSLINYNENKITGISKNLMSNPQNASTLHHANQYENHRISNLSTFGKYNSSTNCSDSLSSSNSPLSQGSNSSAGVSNYPSHDNNGKGANIQFESYNDNKQNDTNRINSNCYGNNFRLEEERSPIKNYLTNVDMQSKALNLHVDKMSGKSSAYITDHKMYNINTIKTTQPVYFYPPTNHNELSHENPLNMASVPQQNQNNGQSTGNPILRARSHRDAPSVNPTPTHNNNNSTNDTANIDVNNLTEQINHLAIVRENSLIRNTNSSSRSTQFSTSHDSALEDSSSAEDVSFHARNSNQRNNMVIKASTLFETLKVYVQNVNPIPLLALFTNYMMIPDADGNMLLHLSILAGNEEISMAILHSLHKMHRDNIKAILEHYNNEQRTPVHLACMKDMCHLLNTITKLYHLDFGLLDENGNSIIHICAAYKSYTCFELLLQYNQELCAIDFNNAINLANYSGKAVLYLIAEDCDFPLCLAKKLFISASLSQNNGKKINVEKSCIEESLEPPSTPGNNTVININIPDGKSGAVPLYVALQNCNYAMVELLLSQPGIIINAQTFDGKGPLDIALANKAPQNIVTLLKENGALSFTTNNQSHIHPPKNEWTQIETSGESDSESDEDSCKNSDNDNTTTE